MRIILSFVLLAAALTACTPIEPTTTTSPVPPLASSAAPAESAPAQVAPAPGLTTAQQNAVGAAENYLSFTGFSRTGLIGQLEFDQYATAEAEVAVADLEARGAVDWNAEAVQAAQDYLSFTTFSRQGLIDQLVFDGFTIEQATPAATAVGL